MKNVSITKLVLYVFLTFFLSEINLSLFNLNPNFFVYLFYCIGYFKCIMYIVNFIEENFDLKNCEIPYQYYKMDNDTLFEIFIKKVKNAKHI